MKRLDELDKAYAPTPERFHRCVQDTLYALKAQSYMEEKIMKRKICWAAVLVAALMILSVVAVAAHLTGVVDFLTNTAARTWVLEDAQGMIHRDGAALSIGDCMASVREWICDGEKLVVTVSITDPALEEEGQYVSMDEEEDYISGIEKYALTHMPRAITLSEGTPGEMSLDAQLGENENEILYLFELPLVNVTEAFSVKILVSCSQGEGTLTIDVTSADFGVVRDFVLPQEMNTQEYTLRVTKLRATALQTYIEAEIEFEQTVGQARREQIANAYLEGLAVPEGKLDVVAGEGEEIAMPRQGQWSKDGERYCLTLIGNPRENYPDTALYCPRWGMETYDWEGEMPELTQEGAIMFSMKEDTK